MKINVTKDAKKWLTVEEAEVIPKEVAPYFKEDEWTAKDYAEMAVRAIFGTCGKVFEAGAEIAGNARVNDALSEHSGRLDVWITYTAMVNSRLMVEGGSYITDLWNISGEPDTQKIVEENSYIRKYRFEG